MSDLSKGERYTNLDYNTAAETEVPFSEIVISYDTTCQAVRATASHAAASQTAASQADASQATASQAAASQADVSQAAASEPGVYCEAAAPESDV